MMRVSIVVKSGADRALVEALASEIYGEPFALTPHLPGRDPEGVVDHWFADALITEAQLQQIVSRAPEILAINLAWTARIDSAESPADDFQELLQQADGLSKFVDVGGVPPDLLAWAGQAYAPKEGNGRSR